MQWIIVLSGAGLLSLGLVLSVLLREKRSLAQASFVGGLVMLALESLLAGLGSAALSEPQAVRWHFWRLLAMQLVPGAWLAFSLVYARGDHRETIRKWRPAILILMLLPLAVLAWGGEQLIRLKGAAGQWEFALPAEGKFLYILFLLASVLVLMNLERTFRGSIGTMRWRIKYMVLGLALLFLLRIYTASQTILYSRTQENWLYVNALAWLMASALIAFSRFRARLFDLDIYPSQALLQNSLTVLVVGAYLLIVGVFANLVGHGDTDFPLEAFLIMVVMAGLSILYFSERLRQKLRRFVSRHFRRPFYDHRQIWSTLTNTTATVTHAPELCRISAKWISDTFQALSVTIWLADEGRKRLVFGASTALVEATAADLLNPGISFETLEKGLLAHPLPFELNDAQGLWVETLKACSPEFFLKGADRVCVPFLSQQQLMGIMVLGDRVNQEPFSAEDLDLLKCVGEQLASYFAGIQMSQKLFQVKELEAFQTMAAFFVHDLKNTTSTLSLMLQNFREHFDNPDFREDALRGISKSVQHLNGLISRLSSLRHSLEVKAARIDLNQVVEAALGALGDPGALKISKTLPPLEPVMADAEQIHKVLLNLFLNARDAMPAGGELQITTAADADWTTVTVQDNGCGMSQEFMARQLFRPFQTTKKTGLGIGMFHSKMIVEAHRGRLEAESQPGQGALFKVMLPAFHEVS